MRYALLLATLSLTPMSTQQPLTPAEHDRRIDYIEMPATNIAATKKFYVDAFGWKFTDYGPDYTSFADGRLAGGFTKTASVQRGGPLIVIFALDLAVFACAVLVTGRPVYWRLLPFLPLFGLFQSYVMRLDRFYAYASEWVFTSSKHDNYTPQKTRDWVIWK